jgi:glyoxylase-like metal-dependent hydrolase (beta-lactamase superfamily II)
LIVEFMPVGPIMANCYIVGCEETREAVVIDPGDDAEKILQKLDELKLKVKYIINTHGHFDHVGANGKLKEATGAELLIHPEDAPMLGQLVQAAAAFGLQSENSPPPDRTIDEGDEIKFGNITFEVIHTPGHSPGGISLKVENYLFVGDTLFSGSIGRTDLPGGNFDTLKASIQKKIFPLGDNIRVFTGHGPETWVGREKKFNPFVGLR